MQEFYSSNADRAMQKSLRREKRGRKGKYAPIGVRYNTLRAGQGLIVKMAAASVKKTKIK